MVHYESARYFLATYFHRERRAMIYARGVGNKPGRAVVAAGVAWARARSSAERGTGTDLCSARRRNGVIL